MMFEVMKLRLEGRVLHRGWWGGQRLWRGNLVVQDRLDPVTHRTMPQAFMRYSHHQDVEALGVLYDARLVHMNGAYITLSGFEREPIVQREFMQSWLLRPISDEEANTPIPADVVRGRGKPVA